MRSTNVSRRSFLGGSVALIGLGLAGCGSKGNSKTESGSAAKAGDKKVAIVCDAAGKTDNGFNQQAIEAAQSICDENGWELNVIEPTNGLPAALETLGEEGYNLVFNMQYDFEALINGTGGASPLAEQYPDTTWVVFNDNPNVDKEGKLIHKNVISVLFNMNENSYLAGALAVLVNENAEKIFAGGDYKFTAPDKTRAMGFIGGTESNGITVFSYGFIQGMQHEAEKLGVKYDYYTKYDAGFTDTAAGSTTAGTYYDNGANIVFVAAGGVGTGVTSKAKEVGKLAIEVDANKDEDQPGYILTSVLKSTNVPAQALCEALGNGSIAEVERVQYYNLESGAVDLTDFATIEKSITSDEGKANWEEAKQEIATLKKQIIDGDIKVVNAQEGETFDPATCPNVNIK